MGYVLFFINTLSHYLLHKNAVIAQILRTFAHNYK